MLVLYSLVFDCADLVCYVFCVVCLLGYFALNEVRFCWSEIMSWFDVCSLLYLINSKLMKFSAYIEPYNHYKHSVMIIRMPWLHQGWLKFLPAAIAKDFCKYWHWDYVLKIYEWLIYLHCSSKSRLVFGRPYYRSSLWYSISSVCLSSVCL